ncbi:DNA gyrase inhibitor YacG [Ramlibacter rhizophilus]|uniref:DNA gyrase inhibitor YacG n=1 Tax=Ramlibacter rhizophilus TaxID=1781167 RepID=A0A4Z0BU83_9BURK|nr:DNA gyrase inhibitor YacG [Ramlibacter rhizophilus]TFZ01565.1 DNA gyrase inhibitor YacG [Ramlibacter rhizophilus]
MSSSKPEGGPAASKPRIVTCPQCKGESLYATSNPYRPFCSERCKNLDLGAWASESFRVETESPPDDQPFGDAHLQ